MKSILLGLIGAGIQRSRSPALLEAEAQAQGLRCVYKLVDLDELRLGIEALPELVLAARRMGFDGLNITYPCKQAVIRLLDDVSEEARVIGAVNAVVHKGGRLVGYNTDGVGWGWGFQRALPKARLDRVVLLGAGGAGSAVADAVLRLGAKTLVIVDAMSSRAAELASHMNEVHGAGRANAEGDIARALERADGLIQATPVGMEKQPGMPLAEQLLRRELWVSEIVYVPLETALLKAARRAGCPTMDGGHMNVGQAVRNFKLFTGLDADVARMDAHFRQLGA